MDALIAAWFDGKDDPKLVLRRFDAEQAEIWLNESSLLAGVKMLLGVDPKRDYEDNTAEVDLRLQQPATTRPDSPPSTRAAGRQPR